MLQDIKKSIAHQLDTGWKLDQIFFTAVRGDEKHQLTDFKVGGIWWRWSERKTREEQRVEHGEFPEHERDAFYEYVKTLARS